MNDKMRGIYKYTDLKTDDVVYVGKDSNIDKQSRHKDHLSASRYNEQPFNRILQNNPDRYEYGVIWATDDCTDLKLNKMEILFGKIYNPKFCFGKFGKGGFKSGHKPWNAGIKNPEMAKEKNPMWKDYARIVKAGIKPSGKQNYKISYNGIKTLKRSVNKESLKKWFKENYPNVELIDETKESNNE